MWLRRHRSAAGRGHGGVPRRRLPHAAGGGAVRGRDDGPAGLRGAGVGGDGRGAAGRRARRRCPRRSATAVSATSSGAWSCRSALCWRPTSARCRPTPPCEELLAVHLWRTGGGRCRWWATAVRYLGLAVLDEVCHVRREAWSTTTVEPSPGSTLLGAGSRPGWCATRWRPWRAPAPTCCPSSTARTASSAWSRPTTSSGSTRSSRPARESPMTGGQRASTDR